MLTFVLLDYKSADATVNCVRHFIDKCRNCKEPFSFVVVDNSVDEENFGRLSGAFPSRSESTFESSRLEEKNVDGYRLLLWKNTENAGYARGNNAGARIAAEFLQSDYLLFSNNDLLALDETIDIDRLVREFAEDHVGMVGPSVVGKNGKAQNPYVEKSFFLRWGLEYLCYPLARFLPKCLQSGDEQESFTGNPVFRVMGSFFLIPRKVFESVEGFDPHTFLFAEEMILSSKLRQKGLLAHYVPEVHLLHNHSEIINKNYDFSKRLMLRFESEAYYYRNYKKVGVFQLFIVRQIVKFYIARKKIAKKLKSLVR